MIRLEKPRPGQLGELRIGKHAPSIALTRIQPRAVAPAATYPSLSLTINSIPQTGETFTIETVEDGVMVFGVSKWFAAITQDGTLGSIPPTSVGEAAYELGCWMSGSTASDDNLHAPAISGDAYVSSDPDTGIVYLFPLFNGSIFVSASGTASGSIVAQVHDLVDIDVTCTYDDGPLPEGWQVAVSAWAGQYAPDHGTFNASNAPNGVLHITDVAVGSALGFWLNDPEQEISVSYIRDASGLAVDFQIV